MANLFLYHAEPRAARGIPLVLNAAARGQELLREGHARLGGGAGVAEADCWSDGERQSNTYSNSEGEEGWLLRILPRMEIIMLLDPKQPTL